MGLVNTNALPNLVNPEIDDESYLPQVVGFYEYNNALKLYDQLAAISSEEEMKTYDRVLASRPEFSIYIGKLSTAKLKGDRVLFGESFKQTGMNWVTALARVELGAMLASFSARSNPFEEVAPTKFDASEFHQLMAEGWESHVLGIRKLAKTNESLRGKLAPGERAGSLVKLARRSKLASDLGVVTAQTLNPATAEGKYQEMQTAYDQLQDYRDQIADQLKYEVKQARKNVNRNSGWATGHIPHCAQGGVEAALAEGRFSIKPLR